MKYTDKNALNFFCLGHNMVFIVMLASDGFNTWEFLTFHILKHGTTAG